MNPISPNLKIGTIGELLVQLRLLEYDVQAAPPLKDSGNDLIAIRGVSIRAIQVKTTTNTRFDLSRHRLPRLYHALALVQLRGHDRSLELDACQVFLLAKTQVTKRAYTVHELAAFGLSPSVIDQLFGPHGGAA